MIYLDNNATTRPDDAVTQAVAHAAAHRWCNPSSVHRGGQEARHAVETARAQVAALINAPHRGVTFTSGGTESINLALRGTVGALARRGGPAPRVVTTRTEHAAVRLALEDLHARGRVELAFIDVDRSGLPPPGALDAAVTPGTALVSVQWANNETGAVMDVAAIGARCRAVGAVFHCDGTQWVGKMPTDVSPAGPQGGTIDLLSFSPHKWHGPKGVGVLWARAGVGLATQLAGTQEHGRRGGTENVPAIVGAGVAAELAHRWVSNPDAAIAGAALRDRLESGVLAVVPGAQVNAAAAPRLWNTTSIAFPHLQAEALLMALSEQGLYASAGAACSSGSLEPSPVLLAMGLPEALAHGSVRFSLCRHTTQEDVDRAVQVIARAARKVGASMPG